MLKDIGINKQILVTHIEPKKIINFICIYGDGSKTLCRGATSSGDGRGFRRASCVRCCVLGRVFVFNHKIMIKVQELPPSIMVTRNLWSARVWVRNWLCKGKTHHPQCTLPKVSCIVVWLFFLSQISIHWSFLRLKAYFSSWESLYLIGLNPNRSKVWILASHLFILCIFNTWGCTLSCNFTPPQILKSTSRF